MTPIGRRRFMATAGAGLAAAGLAPGSLVLGASARPTPAGGDPDLPLQVLARLREHPAALSADEDIRPTRASQLGPFYSSGAPFRAKVCPPMQAGRTLVVSGRVWGFDTRRPLPGAMLDVWHVDPEGNYSTGEDFSNRARLVASETGYYEFESVHPIPYPVGAGRSRSPHIHYRVASPGYRTLVTELFFAGDPGHEQDFLFDPALMMPVEKRAAAAASWEAVGFDIVLEPAAAGQEGA